ncbi:hypothetical protein RJJ65_16950 [Rhizobium hidalgonense]|uniref:Uncharacterized protein n=1 Tax=Rhizobium hidalgonense TaxID=1538159 RepID=A0AAJ2GRH9_9HYPH|nr:hypothetical protein [Rhizobium hidalgonense]MDR9774322.1 hypothetical protein [Rhizobium hidalgonense]
MSLILRSYRDEGVLASERVVMLANADCDVGEFLLLKSIFSRGEVYPGGASAYWFPDALVKKGDYVVLYTKEGSTKNKVSDSGQTTHFFYWGMSHPQWATKHAAAVLMHVNRWTKLDPRNDDVA